MNKPNDCPECYGKKGGLYDRTKCRSCEYHLSCRYFRITQNAMDRQSHIISYEACQDVIEAADFNHTPGCEPEEDSREVRLHEYAEIFRYLLSMDELTLSMMIDIFESGKAATNLHVSDIARIRGVSRQAVHKKLIKITMEYPELVPLFSFLFMKLKKARMTNLRKRSRT